MAIYYLDVDDEITSAAQRIRESADSRIALVVQSGSRVASSRINFKVLSREARRRNRRLAIVAADASVRGLAEAAGLPVFGTVGEYQRAEAARPPTGEVAGAAAELGALSTRGSGSIRARSGGGLAAGAANGAAVLAATPASSSAASSASARGGSRGTQATGKAGVNPPLKHRRRSRIWVGLGAAAVLGGPVVGGYVLLPSATVVLTLRTEQMAPLTFTALIDPSVKSPGPQSDVLPAAPQEFEVKAGGTYKATGENVLETAAIGKVTFSSGNTYLAVPILAGTQVTTATGVAFTTTATVTVPKATLDGLKVIPGTAEVGVVATAKGPGGNVAAGAIVKVPPDLAAALVLVNPVGNKEAAGGGTRSVSLFIQQADIDTARAELAQQLETAFEARMSQPGAAAAGMQLLAPGSRLGELILEPDPESLVGLEQERFDLAATATGTALSVRTVSLRELAMDRLRQAAKPGYDVVEGSVSLTVGDAEAAGNGVELTITARGLAAPAVDEGKIRAAIGGMSPAEAEAYLSRYGTAEVSVWPFWASTVPDLLDFRTEVRVVAPTPAPSTPAPSAAGTPTVAP